MLLTIWYIISSIIGLILSLLGILSTICMSILVCIGVPISIKEKEHDNLRFTIISSLCCLVVSLVVLFVNYIVIQNQKVVTNEIKSIISYQGIANVKNGKFNYNYMYFTQGQKNNYSILKLNPDKCKLHYTNTNEIKIIENHTEYLSKFRFLSMVSFEDNVNYDVYLPEKYINN